MKSCKRLISLFFIVFGLFILLQSNHSSYGSIVDALDFTTQTEVETLIKPENKSNSISINTSYTPLPVYRAVTPVRQSSGYGSSAGNTISIAGRTIPVVYVSDTTVDSSNHVNRYGNSFYYGHNSGAVFGGIVNLGVGSTFSINENGVNRNYRVAKVVIFEKNTSNGRLELNGSGNYMKSVAYSKYGGVQYSVSLMTCYGTSYENGDASHRFVIFANQI